MFLSPLDADHTPHFQPARAPMPWKLVFACAAALLAGAGSAHAEYTFKTIADSSGNFGPFSFSLPAINNSGVVVFPAAYDAGGGGIFKGDGTTTTLVVDNSGPFKSFSNLAAINNSGLIVFNGSLDTGEVGIFTANGVNPVETIVTSASTYSRIGVPQISDAGQISFQARTGDEEHSVESVFVYTQGGVVQYASAGSFFSSFAFAYPTINNGGRVAFNALLRSQSPFSGIYTSDGGGPSRIADDAGNLGLFNGSPDINDSGTVVFSATRSDGADGIFTGNGGPITTIVTNAAPAPYFKLGVAGINNPGRVAFQSSFFDGGLRTGLFITNATGGVDRVIATGDPLAGSTVAELNFTSGGLNDSGQIAFMARLQDGRSGIFRATPQQVTGPHLTTLALNPATLNLQPGRSVSTEVTLTLSEKVPGTVTIPISLTRGGVPVSSPGPFSLKLKNRQSGSATLSFPSSTPAGAYEVSATYGGVTQSAGLTINPVPPLQLSTLAVKPNPVRRGKKITVTATLTTLASATTSIPVTVRMDGQPVPLSITVKVSKNKSSGTGSLTLKKTLAAGTYELSAAFGGVTKSVNLTVTE